MLPAAVIRLVRRFVVMDRAADVAFREATAIVLAGIALSARRLLLARECNEGQDDDVHLIDLSVRRSVEHSFPVARGARRCGGAFSLLHTSSDAGSRLDFPTSGTAASRRVPGKRANGEGGRGGWRPRKVLAGGGGGADRAWSACGQRRIAAARAFDVSLLKQCWQG
jgi:hypothetical protein